MSKKETKKSKKKIIIISIVLAIVVIGAGVGGFFGYQQYEENKVGETNPIMLMTYDYEEDSYINIYRTNGENQVDKIVYQEPATVDFLYNIQYKSYSWYIHTENETEDSYKKIYTVLENSEQNNEAEYTIIKT